MLNHRMMVAIAAGCLATACHEATGPRTPLAIVTVDADTVQASRYVGPRVTWVNFKVPVSIRNNDVFAIDEPGCTTSIEYPAGAGWKMAWSPVCLLVGGVHDWIQPGETRTYEMFVSAAIEGPGAPEWSAPAIEGTYRLSAGLVLAQGGGGLIPRVPSNTFVIREP